MVFDFLHEEMKKITSEVLEKNQYRISGFIFSYEHYLMSIKLGTLFGDGDDEKKVYIMLALHRNHQIWNR